MLGSLRSGFESNSWCPAIAFKPYPNHSDHAMALYGGLTWCLGILKCADKDTSIMLEEVTNVKQLHDTSTMIWHMLLSIKHRVAQAGRLKG